MPGASGLHVKAAGPEPWREKSERKDCVRPSLSGVIVSKLDEIMTRGQYRIQKRKKNRWHGTGTCMIIKRPGPGGPGSAMIS